MTSKRLIFELTLDETSDVEICNAMWETKAYMYAMRQEVEHIIQLLSSTDPISSDKLTKSPETKINIDMTVPNVEITSKTKKESDNQIKENTTVTSNT